MLTPFSASMAQETRALEVSGSSGKYFPEREAACTTAQQDARQSATNRCERDGGRVEGPLIFGTCACEQGGFEEKEWLCSAAATATCAITATAGTAEPVAPPSATSGGGLALSLPADLDRLALLDRTFVRNGLTLPSAELARRMKAACDTGWTVACRSVDWREGTRASLERARPDLERACDAGDADACMGYGWAMEAEGLARKNDEAFLAAARRYKALCDGKKLATACYDYGTILFNELGVKADPRLGINRWTSACELGNGRACAAVAEAQRTGLRGTPVDLAQAKSFAGRGCAAGSAASCVEQAVLERNAQKEQEARTRLCTSGGVDACWELASSYMAGERAEPVAGRTRDLLELGCELGHGRSCTNAGQLALEAGEEAAAASRFRNACKENHVEACTGLATLILADRIDGSVDSEPYAFEVACSRGNLATACSELGLALLDSDQGLAEQPRARALLRQSCIDETSPAKPCFVLGDLYESGKGGERDRTLAATYYKWACAQGWGQACERRGDLLADGVGVRRDHGEAVVTYQSGCEAGLPEACHKAGVLLDEGTYIPRDAKRAKTLYKTACERAVGDACLRLGNLSLDRALGRDEGEARKSFESAVTLGNVEAHRRLAYMLWNGIGGRKDKKRAKALTAEGCKADDPIACRGPAFQTEG